MTVVCGTTLRPESVRVLVGAELGRASQAARALASQIAALGSAEVEGMLVASPEEIHGRLGLESPVGAGLSSDAEAVSLRQLSLAAPETETSAVLREVAGRGQADAQLVARAHQGDFDLVVVGKRRASIIQQIWHRSVARGFLESSSVSVAQVAPAAEVDASFLPPRVVLGATDFTEVDARALAHAVGYAQPGAAVHVAHVVGTFGTPSEVRPARQKLRRDVAVERSVPIHTHVLEGVPTAQLLGLSERLGADLLVLGVRKRTAVGRALLGSLAQPLIEDARVPALVVPARRA